VTDEELREMQERVVMIRELKEHRSWPVFEDYLRYKLGLHQRRVMNGSIADITDYKHETGIVRGLTMAITAEAEVERLVEAELERRRVALEG